jgi:hypothetical protein
MDFNHLIISDEKESCFPKSGTFFATAFKDFSQESDIYGQFQFPKLLGLPV